MTVAKRHDLKLQKITYNSNKKRPAYRQDVLVEEGGFEPPKRIATDLQSAPFGHSGTPPYEIVWSWWTDSNPRPVDYKSTALPTELHQQTSSSTANVILTDEGGFVKGKNDFFQKFLEGEWVSGHRCGQTRCGTCSGSLRQGGAASAVWNFTVRSVSCAPAAGQSL